MPRRDLRAFGGFFLHVLNRSARRQLLFADPSDFEAFERVLREALSRYPTRMLAYCVMPNHWHLVVWPVAEELPRFMHWLTMTHAKRWHQAHGTRGLGPVYQNRYRAVRVQSDRHLLTLIRYVERNALRAQLVDRAEMWRWSSLYRRCSSRDDLPLSEWPIPRPSDWVAMVNEPQTGPELLAIQRAMRRGR